MKQVTEYEVTDHGFEHAQYFPWCVIAGTAFEDGATGAGDTAQEAFEDALGGLAQNDWAVDSIRGTSELSRQSVREFMRAGDYMVRVTDDDLEMCELYAYVSIRVK